jgi:imidazole glycerol-phosphate synthase subunit HisF
MIRRRQRLIPVLLLDSRRRLVKTIAFGARTYIGDPFNIVRLLNEKEVDEICLLDIDATKDGRVPDPGYLRELASECFMPLTYGGGLTSLQQCQALNRAGIEKLVLGSSVNDRLLTRSVAAELGSQAVVACIDVGVGEAPWNCVTHANTRRLSISPSELARQVEGDGAGEILLQSVPRDGNRTGMDLSLIRCVSKAVSVPVIAVGGAGTVDHLVEALEAGASAAASGSAFTFTGRLRAVLINYPTSQEIERAWRALDASK